MNRELIIEALDKFCKSQRYCVDCRLYSDFNNCEFSTLPNGVLNEMRKLARLEIPEVSNEDKPIKQFEAMAYTELCQMCTEYSADTACEYEENCKLKNILKENAELKAKLREAESKSTWDMFPESMGR